MISRLLGLAAAQAALFPAQKLAPPTSIEREAQRRALDLIRETYGAYVNNSTISHHFFVRLAPSTLQHELSKFVWNANALKAVRSRFPAGAFVVPDVYHEIYVMRPEIDFLDADKKHFDGPKVPGLTTLRSLIYLEGTRARFVAETSARNYTTDEGSTIILDFYRELHHVKVNDTAPRVLIKAAIHVFDTETPMNYLKIAAHRLGRPGRAEAASFSSGSASAASSPATRRTRWSPGAALLEGEAADEALAEPLPWPAFFPPASRAGSPSAARSSGTPRRQCRSKCTAGSAEASSGAVSCVRCISTS